MKVSNQKSIAPVQKKEASAVSVVKRLLSNEELQRRFSEILGEKSAAFMASVTNVMSSNDKLQECEPSSVVQASLVAATLDLPIDQNLGFSAIVPYGDKAQFQMMWKGFVQLAMRTGQYRTMGRSVVYEDEIQYYNPIYGDIIIKDDLSGCKQRLNGEDDKIVGYLAWFELLNGFRKELYMSRAEVQHHAEKYSKSYQYDLKKGAKSSRWSIDFDVMAQKTVIKRLLSQWGILSIEMQKAITEDQKVYDGDGNSYYADNPSAPEIPAKIEENASKIAQDIVADKKPRKEKEKAQNEEYEEMSDEELASLFDTEEG